MLRFPRAQFAAALFFLTVLAISGCGHSELPRFYVLQPTAAPLHSIGSGSEGAVVVGVGPVKLPDYLDRPQIVSMSGSSRLEMAEFDRWAEPLEQNFLRVLGDDLSALLQDNRIVLYPWDKPANVKYQVKIDVSRFCGGPDGRALLDARWSLRRDGKEITARRSTFEKPTTSVGYESLVMGLSQTVADLSNDIAMAIRADQGLAP
ncbi:MAG: PqiC family protein [Desulfobacteraceae bacterium]|nr:PqiC family protein [Desulfobacteraceae bacterium]